MSVETDPETAFDCANEGMQTRSARMSTGSLSILQMYGFMLSRATKPGLV